jgi:hypothetical protein
MSPFGPFAKWRWAPKTSDCTLIVARGRIWCRYPARLPICARPYQRQGVFTSICIRVHACGSGNSGRPTRDHALDVRRRAWQAVRQDNRRNGSDLIADGSVSTSAGTLGQQAAQRAARVLVVHHRRAGGQSQHSAMLQLDAKSDSRANCLGLRKA